ncbi:MAG TPA: methyltransferase domain-containing protein [Baekduia sp.]|nr:methyltransferase domain-containing protein [Baekduia sp.]
MDGLLPKRFTTSEWHEVRLDIDPGVDPDIIGTITDMTAVDQRSVDAIWSSHNLEHVFAHEVPLALREFYRVLKPGGTAHVQVPDLTVAARQVARGRLDDVIYMSSVGPITALDMLYGHGAAITRGEHYMAHRTGFTKQTLTAKLTEGGFANVRVEAKDRALWATAMRPELNS